MTSTAASPKASKGSSSSGTIDTLDDVLAQVYTHVHPIALLGLLYFSFPALVADPIDTLSRLGPPVAALQTIYVAVCLPGSNAKSLSAARSSAQRKKGSGPGIGFKVVPAILSLILSVSLGAPLITFVLILFGAPLTTHQSHTLLCAAHMSLLSSLPLIYAFGVDVAKWKEVAALSVPVDEVFGASLGSLIGAWIGAVPIPLDWDREWQRWPVTIVTGAYLGFVVGKIFGAYVFKGARIKIA